MAKGIKVNVDEAKQEITFTLPLIRRMSHSRKSILRATTNGNIESDALIEGEKLVVGINAYTRIEEAF